MVARGDQTLLLFVNLFVDFRQQNPCEALEAGILRHGIFDVVTVHPYREGEPETFANELP